MSLADLTGLLGILLAVGILILILIAVRGFSLLLAAPAVAMLGAAFAGAPLLANMTQTRSASAAHTITLDAFGATLAQLATVANIEPALMHRIASLACGPLSMLPHSGAIVTLLAICGASQKESYGHIGVVTVIGPLLALLAAIVLGLLFGAF